MVKQAATPRLRGMIEIGSRLRNQPPPPHVVFEALHDPDRDPTRPWLRLLADETRPVVLGAEPPSSLVWSSLWLRRPDAQVRFELVADSRGQGTDLRWRLLMDDPVPDREVTRMLCKRIGKLINADLRASFDQ